nr:response regulator [Anaerolineae bacterium]
MPVRVLIIDDDLTILKLLEMSLTAAGMEVMIASMGSTGIAICRENQPDIAVIDIAMPDLDGYAVVDAIRADEERASRRMPVIFLTAHTQLALRDYAERAGVDLFLTKPVDGKALAAHIHDLLKLAE